MAGCRSEVKLIKIKRVSNINTVYLVVVVVRTLSICSFESLEERKRIVQQDEQNTWAIQFITTTTNNGYVNTHTQTHHDEQVYWTLDKLKDDQWCKELIFYAYPFFLFFSS